MVRSALYGREFRVVVAAARAAGLMIRRRAGKPGRIHFKGASDIVTEIDTRAEELIVRRLRKVFPRDGILAEERPQETRGSRTWIIDPLDGTTNFAHGLPFFAVSIGLQEDDQVVLGVVYDPSRDELFAARRGQGAFCNGTRISVSRQRRMRHAFLATGFPYSFKKNPDPALRHFRVMMLASMAVRRAGAAALDLCYVACGRFDGFWEKELKPWDTAAAGLILTEAGGTASCYDGSRFDCYATSMVASNGHLHRAMVRLLKR